MRAHTLNRVVASLNFGNDRVVIVGVEPSAVTDLPAGFSIERGVVENDLALFAGLKLLGSLAVADDRKHFAVFRASLAVTFEGGFRKLLISGIGSLLRRTLP